MVNQFKHSTHIQHERVHNNGLKTYDMYGRVQKS